MKGSERAGDHSPAHSLSNPYFFFPPLLRVAFLAERFMPPTFVPAFFFADFTAFLAAAFFAPTFLPVFLVAAAIVKSPGLVMCRAIPHGPAA